MMKLKITPIGILIALVLVCCKHKSGKTFENSEANANRHSFLSKEYIENYTFRNEGNDIKLTNGELKTEYENYSIVAFDIGDINNDEVKDLFILLKNNTQGSGTFYFTNLLVGNANEELEFIEEKFIGDRIKPIFMLIYKEGIKDPVTKNTIHPDDYGLISIGYFEHSEDQAFGEEPKLFTTSKWKFSKGKMIKIN